MKNSDFAFSLSEESVNRINSLLEQYTESIVDLINAFQDELIEHISSANYEKLHKAVSGIIDLYNDSVRSELKNCVFEKWQDAYESLVSFAQRMEMGEESEIIAAGIEDKLGLLFDTNIDNRISSVNVFGITSASILDFEHIKSIISRTVVSAKDLSKDYSDEIENLSNENEFYNFLAPVMIALITGIVAFFEQSEKSIYDLENNYVNKMEAKKNAVHDSKKAVDLSALLDFSDLTFSGMGTTLAAGSINKKEIMDDYIEKKIDTVESMETSNVSDDGNANRGEKCSRINKLLTNDQVETIRRETGWSDIIISYLRSMAEYKIYRDANLREIVIGSTRALIRRDLNWEQKDKKGLTNAQRIKKGRAPIDENGISIELHHIGQHVDSPLAELTRDDHRGKGNDTILHDKSIASEAHGEGNNWDKERACFWKERDEFNNFYKEKYEPKVLEIGKDRSLSVAERIKKIQELYEEAKYKRDISVPVDPQYVKGFYDNGSIIYDWPSRWGFDTFEPVSKDKPLPISWDRYGHLGGNYFSDIPNSGRYSYAERSIPYIENEDAYHFGEFNTSTYFEKIDAIRKREIKTLNAILEREGIQRINEAYFDEIYDDYEDFLSDAADSFGTVDATYGLQGVASRWGDMKGGAKQYVTPLSGEVLRRIGILIERK